MPHNYERLENFGVPARWQPSKPGPSPDRDLAYKVYSSSGKVPGIRCKACGDTPPIKSNTAIAAEVDRLSEESGIWRLEERAACRNGECENSARPIAFHPGEYRKRGKPKSGQGQYYQCKRCGRRTLVSDPVRLHDRNRRHAADLLGRIANKSPVRGAARGGKLRFMRDYYEIVDFLHRRCRAYSAAFDRALIDGRPNLPEDMDIQSDAQVYRLNWVSRLDRRNVELSTYCSVHSESHFVLAMHCNFDSRVDPFGVNTDAARSGDLARPEAFRKYAQYWLAGDELQAGRAMGRRSDDKARIALLRQIERLYADAASRKDVENIELHGLNEAYATPFLSKGLQVHMPYTAYAHWFLLHRVLTGAGVRQVQANIDIDSMGRAAFLTAFAEEVKRGDAQAFFVKSTKHQTIDERREILAKSKRARVAFAQTLPRAIRRNRREVARRMMKVRIGERQKHGKWDDEWVEHPLPTLNEPHKAVSWLTPDPSIGDDRKADMFLRSGLGRVDNVFLKTRRLFNALERPLSASSGQHTVWHGYAPYNPAMLEKYVTIFRAVNNFVFVGDDGATPAMRIGFAKAPLDFADLLWPGQRVPRHRQRLRKGKRLAIA